jgi:hypothetical protein
LDLFSINDDVGSGLVLWHPKGAFTRNKIRDFWEEEHVKNGYLLVCTPHIAREELEDFRASRVLQGEHVSFQERRRKLRGETHELPISCPNLQVQAQKLQRPADKIRRVGNSLQVRTVRNTAGAVTSQRIHPRRRPHLLHAR